MDGFTPLEMIPCLSSSSSSPRPPPSPLLLKVEGGHIAGKRMYGTRYHFQSPTPKVADFSKERGDEGGGQAARQRRLERRGLVAGTVLLAPLILPRVVCIMLRSDGIN